MPDVIKYKAATLALILGLLNTDHSFGDTSTMANLQTAEACGELVQAASFNTRAVKSMVVIGDSISRAFNSVNGNFFVSGSCAFTETLSNNWATNDNTTARCKADTVYSLKERLECANSRDIAALNVAKSGASMAQDIYSQSVATRNWLVAQPGPRHVAILMGHNDICQGTQIKNTTCNNNQKSPTNYCRTAGFTFEKEFRRSLDVLARIPNTRIGVAIPVRVSQACSLKGKNVACYFLFDCSCQDVWNLARLELFDIFKGPGICRSLTANGCSNTRVVDAYRTWKQYKEIFIRVTQEYDAIAPGNKIPANAKFGTGNIIKAAGVDLDYSEAIANYKLQSADIGQCDCYHPNKTAQNKLASYLYTGLTCTKATPCCRDTGNDLNDGLCRYTWTDGRKIKGFW